jgi:hypothetical protein
MNKYTPSFLFSLAGVGCLIYPTISKVPIENEAYQAKLELQTQKKIQQEIAKSNLLPRKSNILLRDYTYNPKKEPLIRPSDLIRVKNKTKVYDNSGYCIGLIKDNEQGKREFYFAGFYKKICN